MSRMKKPLSRRDRYILRQIYQGNEDAGSLCSRPEPIPPPQTQYDHPHFFQGQPSIPPGQYEPQSPAPSSVFLPAESTRKQVVNGGQDRSYEVALPNSSPGECQTDVAPRHQMGYGDVSAPPSVPPSVPTEYQFQWPPNTTMNTVPEESIYGGGERYEYKYDASCWDVFWCLWAIVTYLFDIGSDLFVAIMYFRHGHIFWFALTLSFVIVPGAIMSLFSLALYMRDWKVVGDKATPIRWASRAIFLCLQLGPLLRLIDTLYYACKSRKALTNEGKMHYFERMVDEDVDSMTLRLFEAFLEAAPQLVLQIYVLEKNGLSDGWLLVALQFMSLGSSLVTLAITMVSYQKALRQSQKDKAKLGKCAMASQFLWRILTIGSRVVALAMFASYFGWWVFVVCGVHMLLMLLWVVQMNTKYCLARTVEGEEVPHKGLEVGFQCLAAFVQIFCFFNLIEGHTRLRALLYYSLRFLEDTALVVAWYVAHSTALYSVPEDHHNAILGVVMGGFAGGILFMLIYYKCAHPNNTSPFEEHREIKWWVKCDHLSLCYDKATDEVDAKEAISPEELERIQTEPDQNKNTSYEAPETVRSYGPRKCVDPIPRTETPHNLSVSYREPEMYDSYLKLNTSKRSVDPVPRSYVPPPPRGYAYRPPQTLDSLLRAPPQQAASHSTAV